jgi:N-acetylglucosaminyl-diphospho-decaprenol L-rhamnosyltransferase
MKLSVIIVNYNVKYYVEQCVASLYRSMPEGEMEVFVVDNASTDGSVEYLKNSSLLSHSPNFYLIENKENVGFGKANNIAFEQSRGEYVLFINPDTIVSESCLKDCIAFFESHDKTGGVGVRMLKPNGEFALESRRGLPTPFVSLCKMLGLSKLFPHSRRLGRYYMQYLDDKGVCSIDIVSGAFMMIPRQVLQEVGCFDTEFFMYGEDIDLSYRILKAGYKNFYLPVPILHYKGESTEKTSYRYVYVFYKAMLIFLNKHYRHLSLFLSFPIQLFIFLMATKALVTNWFRKLHGKSQRKALPYHPKYLFIGSSEMLSQAREMSCKWNLDADYVEGSPQTLPLGHLQKELGYDLSNYSFIVYDMNTFSIGQVLNIFDRSESTQYLLGTYYPDRCTLITNQNVFQL